MRRRFGTTRIPAYSVVGGLIISSTTAMGTGLRGDFHAQSGPGIESSRHCQAPARLYDQAAAENRAMARIQEELAAQPEKARDV